MEHIRVNDKIRLEKVKTSMASTIFNAINSDREYLSEWLPFVEFTKKVSDTEAFISSVKDSKLNEIYSIWYKEDFAGLIGFKDTDSVNRKTEIGYWLIQNMQKKGIATSSVEKLMNYAFKKLKINRIQIKVACLNNKSEAIPIKLGFKFEGIERAGEWHNNQFLDLKVYSFLKSDLLN